MKNVVCKNKSCSEFDVVKTGLGGDMTKAEIECGACCEHCNATDADVTEVNNANPAN